MTAGRTNTNAHSQHWCTPPEYVETIRRFFGGTIGLDPCSNPHSLVHASVEYSLPTSDGLTSSWDYPTIFVNPPYGRDGTRGTTIRDWLRRCAEARRRYGSEVLALVPVASNTRHWKSYVFGAATAVAFLYDTRLKFVSRDGDDDRGAPMSCAVIYWGGDYERFEHEFLIHGAVVDVRHLHDRPVGVSQPTLSI